MPAEALVLKLLYYWLTVRDMSGYRFEKLDRSRLADASRLFKECFGINFDENYLDRKLSTYAGGLSYIGYIGYSPEGDPACYYAVWPYYAEYNGKRYLIAQHGDVMTAPAHQGKGLFRQIGALAHKDAISQGIDLFYCLPNEKSYPGYRATPGWEHYDDLQVYLVRSRTLSWVRLKRLLNLSSTLHTSWCNMILSRLPKGEPFQNSVIEPGVAGVVRDKDFVRYKSYNINYMIRVCGINLWVKYDDDFLIIGDMERCDDARFDKVITRLKNIAQLMGLHHIRFHTSRGTFHERNFKRHGRLFERSYPIGGINYTGRIPLSSLKLTSADNDNF